MDRLQNLLEMVQQDNMNDVIQVLITFTRNLVSDATDLINVFQLNITSEDVARFRLVVTDGIKTIFSKVRMMKSDLKTLTKDMIQSLIKKMDLLESTVIREINVIVYNIHKTCTKLKYEINVQAIKLKDQINTFILYFNDEALKLFTSVVRVFTFVVENLTSIPEFENLTEFLNEHRSWFIINIHEYDSESLIKILTKLVAEDLHMNYYELESYINLLSDLVLGNYDSLMNTPIGNYINQIFNNIYYKVKWLWKYSEMFKNLKDILYEFLIDTDLILESFIDNIEKSVMRNDNKLKSTLTISPDFRVIEFSQELPVDWSSFKTMPNVEQLPVYSNSVETANKSASLDKYKYYLYDALTYYSDNMLSLRSIIPEFSSTAMLSGNYIVTFDNLIYDLSDAVNKDKHNCSSYILASDFYRNKFTIFVNYVEKDQQYVKDSLTVLTEGYTINIDFNSKLIINGKKTEMPQTIGKSIVVYRDINNIVLDSKHGFSVNCDMKYRVCKLKLSGWYFGKTAGLLGTYNNEQRDDFSFANGTVTRSVDEFVNSWMMHKNSRHCTNNNDEIYDQKKKIGSEVTNMLFTDTLVEEKTSICRNYFESRKSIFKTCFSHVEPEPYLQMCNKDVNKTKVYTDIYIVLCTVSSVYVSQCENVGVKLNMPFVCSRCDPVGETVLSAGATLRLFTPLSKSTDVVLIIEQSSCVQNVEFSYIIDKLDKALSSSGIKDNRYAVITYASRIGINTELSNGPVIRTVDGNIWSDAVNVGKSFKRKIYQPSNDAISPDDDVFDNNNPPAYKSLRYATMLPFRPGASKTVILVQCQRCSNSYEGHSFAAIMQTMLDNDITLHILQDEAILNSNTKSNAIFGVDINGAFTGRNIRSLLPSSHLLKQVSIPKDMCTPLALETNGTLFSLERISKKFMDVWVRRVAQTASPSDCQQCSCLQMSEYSSNVVCRKCSNEVPKKTQDSNVEDTGITDDNTSVNFNDDDSDKKEFEVLY